MVDQRITRTIPNIRAARRLPGRLAAAVLICGLLPAAGSAPARAADAIAVDLASPVGQRLMPVFVPGGLKAEPPFRPADLKGRQGSVDFAVAVPDAGWYLLALRAEGPVGRLSYRIDPGGPAEQLVPPAGAAREGRSTTGWAWLRAGAHVVRLENLFWTGFPALEALELQPARPDSNPFRLLPPATDAFRLGRCDALSVQAGGTARPFTLVLSAARPREIATRVTAQVPPGGEPQILQLDLPCDVAGDYRATLAPSSTSADQKSIPLGYSVTDVRPVTASFRKGPLVASIDLVDRMPDYAAGASSVRTGPAGRYRVTGGTGWLRFSHGARSSKPDWIAYRLDGLQAGRPTFIEVDYPDDAKRTLATVIREGRPDRYAPTFGAETGGEWPLSNRMATAGALFWPLTAEPRVVLGSPQEGEAAAAAIRVFGAERVLSPRPPGPGRPTREFRSWHEEGLSFLDSVGSGSRGAIREGLERWLESLSDLGVTTVSPTVVIYSFQLYPSRFNVSFQDGNDVLRATLLEAERLGMRVVPQLHPRADELRYVADEAEWSSRLLLSKDGTTNLFDGAGRQRFPPFFNPLDPAVADWYVGMVGELADRYRDSRAFTGIDLRVMDWQNPTLNNLGTLDWGYNAALVRRFFAESGIPYPDELARFRGDDPAAAKARHRMLTGPLRDRWIAWRCEAVAALLTRLRDRIRAARPDLVLYLTTTSIVSTHPNSVADLREGGIDPASLGRIDGVEPIDSRLPYGRRVDDETWGRTMRHLGFDPGYVAPFGTPSRTPATTHYMQYVESVGEVLPPEPLGLPPGPLPFISTAFEPPAPFPLERYATMLGLSDVVMLGDGGNGAARPPALARDFIRTFTRLPAEPFGRVENVPDSVVLRTRPGFAYLVNLQPVPIAAELAFPPGVTVRRLGEDGGAADAAGRVVVRLPPFGLAAWGYDEGAAPPRATVRVPDEVSIALAATLDRAAGAAAARCGRSASFPLPLAEACMAHLAQVAEARRLQAAGRLWGARRIVESAAFREGALALRPR